MKINFGLGAQAKFRWTSQTYSKTGNFVDEVFCLYLQNYQSIIHINSQTVLLGQNLDRIHVMPMRLDQVPALYDINALLNTQVTEK